MIKTDKPEKLVHVLLDFGELLLESGAEVNRVEDTLNRIALAYGVKKVNIFVITSEIVITVDFFDTNEVDLNSITETRRIFTGGTDFTTLERTNRLCRHVCRVLPAVDDVSNQLEEIRNAPQQKKRWFVLGSALASGSFAVFFGGSVWDGLVAALFGFLIAFQQLCMTKVCPNKVTFNIICSLITGLCIGLTAKVIPGLHSDKVMIGDIMLVIPGITMTNSLRDIIMGDTVSGIIRLIESVLLAGALALGFMLSIYLIGLI